MYLFFSKCVFVIFVLAFLLSLYYYFSFLFSMAHIIKVLFFQLFLFLWRPVVLSPQSDSIIQLINYCFCKVSFHMFCIFTFRVCNCIFGIVINTFSKVSCFLGFNYSAKQILLLLCFYSYICMFCLLYFYSFSDCIFGTVIIIFWSLVVLLDSIIQLKNYYFFYVSIHMYVCFLLLYFYSFSDCIFGTVIIIFFEGLLFSWILDSIIQLNNYYFCTVSTISLTVFLNGHHHFLKPCCSLLAPAGFNYSPDMK